ncbi:hypothetical protein NCF86_00190 [Pelagerythrobacter marinus]|nr:hypothetical protein NCF86_00190 [Pelagerythrobacter marinus]
MIELPDRPAPTQMEPTLLDYGSVQRGAASQRINRPGSRYRMAFSTPPMEPDTSRKFVARLLRAKREGLRVKLPLIVPQGIPGTPVVNGAGQAGTTIALRGLTPGYIAKEGFWLNIVEADGTSYLHSVFETAVADENGEALIEIEPALRAPFADGDSVELSAPWIEGFVVGEDWSWVVPVNRYIALSFPVEEYQ